MTRGYGKIILFGEHAVVYGYPALAAGLMMGIRCEIEKRETDFRLDVPAWGISMDAREESPLGEAVRIVLGSFPEKASACRAILIPEIPSRAGLGSSAATIVALIKGLLLFYGLSWENDRINELAFQAEAAFHGTPSGIDNTVATYGGLCYLCDPDRFSLPEERVGTVPLKRGMAALLPPLEHPLPLVIVNTGEERETKALVQRVRALISSAPESHIPLLEEIGEMAMKGHLFLREKQYASFGELMNQNHRLLKRLNVSSPSLEKVSGLALEAGAMGAKLTGAGGGGCLIAFGPGQEENIVSHCRENGFPAFIATIR